MFCSCILFLLNKSVIFFSYKVFIFSFIFLSWAFLSWAILFYLPSPGFSTHEAVRKRQQLCDPYLSSILYSSCSSFIFFLLIFYIYLAYLFYFIFLPRLLHVRGSQEASIRPADPYLASILYLSCLSFIFYFLFLLQASRHTRQGTYLSEKRFKSMSILDIPFPGFFSIFFSPK